MCNIAKFSRVCNVGQLEAELRKLPGSNYVEFSINREHHYSTAILGLFRIQKYRLETPVTNYSGDISALEDFDTLVIWGTYRIKGHSYVLFQTLDQDESQCSYIERSGYIVPEKDLFEWSLDRMIDEGQNLDISNIDYWGDIVEESSQSAELATYIVSNGNKIEFVNFTVAGKAKKSGGYII